MKKLVRKKEFIAATFDSEYKTFVIYVTSFKSLNNDQISYIHFSYKAKIIALIANKIFSCNFYRIF